MTPSRGLSRAGRCPARLADAGTQGRSRPTTRRSHCAPDPLCCGAGPALVGMTGFEPATLRSQSGCATKLRHIPSPADARRCGGRRRPDRESYGPPIMNSKAGSATVCDAHGEMAIPPAPYARGCSSMVEPQSSKLITRVRFPSSPPRLPRSCAPSRQSPPEPVTLTVAGFVVPPPPVGRGPRSTVRYRALRYCGRCPNCRARRRASLRSRHLFSPAEPEAPHSWNCC